MSKAYTTLMWADVDHETAHAAADNLSSGDAALVAFTGKIASGKDSIGQAVMNQQYPSHTLHHGSFASALKEEVSEVIIFIQSSYLAKRLLRGKTMEFYYDFAQEIADLSSITFDQALHVFLKLFPHVIEEDVISAYDRTPPIRQVLQYWGTEIRRAGDDSYWVKKSLQTFAPLLAQGQAIWVSDVRFTNEADTLKDLGAFLLRLEVTPETQLTRLAGRDGITMSEEARLHPSETDLDNYAHFSLVVDNNDAAFDDVVQKVCMQIGVFAEIQNTKQEED